MLAITNARIYTGMGEVYDKAHVLIKNGKIAAIGPNIEIPSQAVQYDASGKTAIPGLVEAHCHLATRDGTGMQALAAKNAGAKELGGPTTPDWHTYYSFNPFHPQLKYAVRAGVTTILTRPGSGKVINGIGLVTKTFGRSRSQMVLRRESGVKMAFGENPKRAFGSKGQLPATRMGVAAVLRDALVKADNYRKRKRKAKKEGKPFSHNLTLEPLVRVLEGELVARVHCHRHDDIMSVLRIADEFNIKLSLEHATEAYKVAEEIAKRDIPCVTGPSFASRDKVELRDETFANPGILEQHGILTAITTDASIVGIEYLRTQASLAHREGMTAEGALKAITINPARIIGVDDRVGSLEVGKDADIVLLNGEPLEFLSRVEQVFVNGVLAYDRNRDREDWELLLEERRRN